MTFAHNSHYESWVLRMWLIWAHGMGYEFWLVNGMLRDDSCESSMDFALWLAMSHRALYSARWWVTRIRVVGRCLYKALGSDQEIGHEPSLLHHEPSLLHLRRLKSQHHGKSSSLSPTHLSSPTMATAQELMLSHLPSSPEARMPPLLGVLVPVHRWHPLMKFGSPPYPALALHLA